jgi:GNAT superfamily N-acetyltransferase
LKEEFLWILEIYNNSFAQHWSARPLDGDEWLAIMEESLSIMPEELFLIAEDQGEPIAFLFHYNDSNQKMYNERHGINEDVKRIKAYVIGSKKEYQRLGIGKWMSIVAAERMYKLGYEEISFSWIDANNTKSLSLSTGMGGKIDKIYRIYNKVL